ncbi:MAG TPA: hypothetical protein VGO96_15995 [Pyrinomonadaceae bacterium]|jgi:hypothetical protein|nr:hypothetical protein [Pyrinomonadaceae bacterium]
MRSNKVWRALVANLLVVLLMTNANGGSFITKRAAPAAQDEIEEEKITAEEEREARELAERFLRRMHETNDLAPLVGEMFVPDYGARLKQEATNNLPVLLSRSAVEEASREELVRYDLALNNSFYLAGLFGLAYKNSHPSEVEGDADAEVVTYFKQAILPDIIELCMKDSILKALLATEADESAEENQSSEATEKSEDTDKDKEKDKDTDAEDEPIRSVERLRDFTSTLEQAIVLARKHLAASPVKVSLVERHKGASEEENWEAELEALQPRAWVSTREFYGYPAGTRIFCVTVLMYHMELVRVDGRLKVLALYLDMD